MFDYCSIQIQKIIKCLQQNDINNANVIYTNLQIVLKHVLRSGDI